MRLTPVPPLDDAGLERLLIDLEEHAWRARSSTAASADLFREVLTAHALMVLPGVVLEKDRALKEIAAASPWVEFRIEEPRMVRLTEESAVLVYRATARRESEPEYHGLVSSVYVENDGRWKLVLHQHTPLPSV